MPRTVREPYDEGKNWLEQSRDDAAASGGITYPLQVNSEVLLTGVADDANNSEPSLVVYPASGSEAAILLADTFTDGATWRGLWIESSAGGAVTLRSQVNGSRSNTSLDLSTGSGGLRLSSSNGPTSLTGTLVRQSAPASTPAASLFNSEISFYLDEVGNKLKVAVKYSDGTAKTGEVALT